MVAHLLRPRGDEFRRQNEGRLRRRVSAGIDEAARKGITQEADVALYLRLLESLDPGRSSGKLPYWARRWLRNTDLTPRRRLCRVVFESQERNVAARRVSRSTDTHGAGR